MYLANTGLICISAEAACAAGWTASMGMNTLGLTQQFGASTAHDGACMTACYELATCLNVDFNFLDRTCWFGFTENPPKLINSYVNHWDLNRSACSGQSSFNNL